METKQVRPYFLPEDLDMSEFPVSLQKAFEAIIQPAYIELVIEAPTALEKNAGATLTFLMVMELLEQFERGSQMGDVLRRGVGRSASVTDEDVSRCLRIISAKQKAASFLAKIKKFCNEQLSTPASCQE